MEHDVKRNYFFNIIYIYYIYNIYLYICVVCVQRGFHTIKVDNKLLHVVKV